MGTTEHFVQVYPVPHGVDFLDLFGHLVHDDPGVAVPFADLLELAIVDDVVELSHLFVDHLKQVGLVGARVDPVDRLNVPRAFVLQKLKFQTTIEQNLLRTLSVAMARAYLAV